MTDLFVLVISMWGLTAQGEWTYIGNQYVNNNPMPLENCEALIADNQWSDHRTNEYNDIQFDCFHVNDQIKR